MQLNRVNYKELNAKQKENYNFHKVAAALAEYGYNSMRFPFYLVIVFLFIPLVSFGQSFELTNGQSMCMIGKGPGQDATVNPFADEDYSYALVENVGSVDFQIRIESSIKDVKQFSIKPSGLVVIKLYRDEILYFDALTTEKVEATVKYTLNESELPPPPPPVNKS